MTARLDVPALLRRVERGAKKGAGDCMCPPASSGPPYEPCELCRNVDADTAFLSRLADAVEEWQKDPVNGKVLLALLRGEVEP